MARKRLVITGIGPIASCGIGKESFWQGILGKKINIRDKEFSFDEKPWGKFPLYAVDNFNISDFGIDKNKLNDIRDWKEGDEIPDLNYLIASIKLALDDSRLDYSQENNGIGLILAHENMGLMPFVSKICDYSYNSLVDKNRSDISKKSFFEDTYYNFLKSAYDVQVFADLFHIARVFNIKNYSLFINNACASGLYALEAASQVIKNDQATAVVVAASDYPEMYKYLWFHDLGIYSSDGRIRPFCSDCNGLVFGEAGIGIVLEDLKSARKRKAPIYAEYLGAGFDLEGYKITMPELGSDSYQRAIKRSFSQANIKKEKIDLVCPHGVGSKVTDYYEAKALTDIFGLNFSKPLVTTFKPYVGHSLGASALLETAIGILSLKNNVVPATLNSEHINSKLNLFLVKETREANLKALMRTCCAFAGYNSAAIFKKY
jgi:3-oxoacyl-(acyl-carrier-protein) synthase